MDQREIVMKVYSPLPQTPGLAAHYQMVNIKSRTFVGVASYVSAEVQFMGFMQVLVVFIWLHFGFSILPYFILLVSLLGLRRL